ncbi:MAG TPA: hypothetical protein VGG72_20185 [Bryobacteraceae bacterium]|jgi:hypothetical protein
MQVKKERWLTKGKMVNGNTFCTAAICDNEGNEIIKEPSDSERETGKGSTPDVPEIESENG